MTKKKFIALAVFALIAALSIVLVGCAGIHGSTTDSCEVANCKDAGHAHGVCPDENCAAHSHGSSCTSDSCTQVGGHEHNNDETEGHQHEGTGGCANNGGEQTHGGCGSSASENENIGRGCCSKNR